LNRTLIGNADWIVTVDATRRIITDGAIAFSSRGGAHSVIADGRMLMRAGTVRTLDEAAVLAAAQTRAEALLQRANLARFCRPAWPVE